MKRKNLSLFFITLFISLLASCRDELSTAGGKWVESSLRTIQTDTCTVRLSTILSDSLATSGDTVCQIGTIDDLSMPNMTYRQFHSVKMPTTDSTPLPSGSIHRVTIWEIP